MIYLSYFHKSKGAITSSYFNNSEKIDIINEKYIVSITEVNKYHTPLSNNYIGDVAIVTMINGDFYYINEESLESLKKQILTIKN